jgi:DNA-binding response OmpR family regulator
LTAAVEGIVLAPEIPGAPPTGARARSQADAAASAANPILVIDDDLVPSVILLDMRMPVLDGWGFAERLRERRLPYPIVVMTAAESARRWAEEIGADAYIAKPFDVNELLQIIERHRRRGTKAN